MKGRFIPKTGVSVVPILVIRITAHALYHYERDIRQTITIDLSCMTPMTAWKCERKFDVAFGAYLRHSSFLGGCCGASGGRCPGRPGIPLEISGHLDPYADFKCEGILFAGDVEHHETSGRVGDVFGKPSVRRSAQSVNIGTIQYKI